MKRVSAVLVCVVFAGTSAVSMAQAAFDRDKAVATAKEISTQVAAIRGQLSSPPDALATDLRELEGHAEHLHSGIDYSNLSEETTAPVVKHIEDLTLAVDEQAKKASLGPAVLKSIAAVQANVDVLESLYGIDVAAPAPPKPRPAPPAIAKADPCKQKVQLTGIEFAFDSDALTPASDTTLKLAVDKLQKCEKIAVQIDGYTDSTGPAKFNQTLSQKRADAVQAYLVKNGVAASRLTAKGDGEADPIASNATIAGRAENRRVELTPSAS